MNLNPEEQEFLDTLSEEEKEGYLQEYKFIEEQVLFFIDVQKTISNNVEKRHNDSCTCTDIEAKEVCLGFYRRDFIHAFKTILDRKRSEERKTKRKLGNFLNNSSYLW